MLVIAHGIVGRADLPIPEALFGAAAAAVLVVSFLALAAGWSEPRLETIRERPLFRIPIALEVVLGALGVAAFAVTVYAGLAGTDSQQDNLAPTAVYVGVSARGGRSAGRRAGSRAGCRAASRPSRSRTPTGSATGRPPSGSSRSSSASCAGRPVASRPRWPC